MNVDSSIKATASDRRIAFFHEVVTCRQRMAAVKFNVPEVLPLMYWRVQLVE